MKPNAFVLAGFTSLCALLGPQSAIGATPSSIWGSYGAGPGQFYWPEALALDRFGQVFVADTYNRRAQKFSATGQLLLQWGRPGNADGQFGFPNGIAADASGNVYVASSNSDYSVERVQKFSADSVFIAKWGTSGTGPTQMHFPRGMTFDASGYLYVADSGNLRVLKFTQDGTYVGQWGDATVFGESGPSDVAVDSHGFVYVVDFWRVKKFTSDGTYVATIGQHWNGLSPGGFTAARACALDSNDNLYVVDSGRNLVLVFGPDGTPLNEWGGPGSAPGQFDQPYGIRIDASDNIYVLDTHNNRVQVFTRASVPVQTSTWGKLKAAYR